jgi:hypothetical protein
MKLFVEDRIVMLVQRTVMDVCSSFYPCGNFQFKGGVGGLPLKGDLMAKRPTHYHHFCPSNLTALYGAADLGPRFKKKELSAALAPEQHKQILFSSWLSHHSSHKLPILQNCPHSIPIFFEHHLNKVTYFVVCTGCFQVRSHTSMCAENVTLWYVHSFCGMW